MAANYEKLGIIIDSSGVVRAGDDLQRFTEQSKKAEGSANKLGGAIGKMAAVIGSALSIKALTTAVFNATKSFESLQASLVTVTGSTEDAQVAFDTIQEFAKTTPFALEEVTQAFIKMQALGLDPSQRALTSYGDTASAMGKSLDQMIEAVADAATGEFERLKEFGIKAKSEGDRVTFTFRGVATEVGKNSQEIERYLINLGETNFAGGMERQMDTLAGKVSNLEDQWQTTFAAIGNITKPVMEGAISLLTDLGSAIEDVFLTWEEYAQKHGLVASEAEKVDSRLRVLNLQIESQQIILDRAIASMNIYTQAFTSQGLAVDTTTEYYKQLKKSLDDATAAMGQLKDEQAGLTWNQEADAQFDAIDQQFADAAKSRADSVASEKAQIDALHNYELEQAIKQADELNYWAQEKIRRDQEYRANQTEAIYQQLDAELQSEQDAHDKKLALEQETRRMQALWRQKDLDEEKAAIQAKIQAGMQIASFMSSSLSQIAGMQNKQSKQGFEDYKKFTKAQIAIDTAMGAMKAYSSLAAIPIVGPALGAAAAAVVTGLGAAQMAKVEAQQFQPSQTIAYAKGGVVDSPTFFSTPTSPSNVMGEAGPEAIMPLKRGADGKLGVAVVNNYNQTTAETMPLKRGADGKLGVLQTVAYAKGGVVDSPTFFSTPTSPSNVMGEAGPEAIMPLKRGADGKLGVAVVNNYNQTTAETMPLKRGADGKLGVLQTVAYAKGGVVDSPTFLSTLGDPGNIINSYSNTSIQSPRTVEVSQPVNVNFNINAVDAAGIDQLLVSRQSLITNMVRRGMR